MDRKIVTTKQDRRTRACMAIIIDQLLVTTLSQELPYPPTYLPNYLPIDQPTYLYTYLRIFQHGAARVYIRMYNLTTCTYLYRNERLCGIFMWQHPDNYNSCWRVFVWAQGARETLPEMVPVHSTNK